MKRGQIVAVAAVSCALLGGTALYFHERKKKTKAAQAAAAPPPPPAPVLAAKPAPPPAQLAAAGRAVVAAPVTPPPAPPPMAGISLPSVNQIRSAVQNGLSPLGTVKAGIQLQNALGDVATAVGGKGAGDVARVAPAIVGAGVIIGKGAEAVAEKLGVSKPVAKTVGQLTGVGVVAGPAGIVAAAGIKAAGTVTKAVVGKVLGQGAATAISKATSQLDPFKSGSIANKPVAVVSKGVKAVGSVFKKLF